EAGYMFVTTLSEKDPPVLASGRCPYSYLAHIHHLFTFIASGSMINQGRLMVWQSQKAANQFPDHELFSCFRHSFADGANVQVKHEHAFLRHATTQFQP
ncbi:hypothetical protein, partial [Erwinia mallotivora]|uniref:hypothetical protein n=1 Tax=Erwinia mallotivora TaxID=69222 RepID=UPI0021BEBB75